MSDNVIQFPGKATAKVASKVEKNEKVTQQQALAALQETSQMSSQMMNSIGKIAQAQIHLEEMFLQMDSGMSVLIKTLIDKSIITPEDWELSWDKYITQPKERSLEKHIEQMKTTSAEEAYYATVLEMVKNFSWADRQHEGQVIPGKQIRDYYIQTLLNPTTRQSVLPDIKIYITDLPSMVTPTTDSQVVPPAAESEDPPMVEDLQNQIQVIKDFVPEEQPIPFSMMGTDQKVNILNTHMPVESEDPGNEE